MGMNIFSSNLLQTISIWQSAATNHYTVSESCCLLRLCVETLLKRRDLTINVVFLSATMKDVTKMQSIKKKTGNLKEIKFVKGHWHETKITQAFYTFDSLNGAKADTSNIKTSEGLKILFF